MIGPIAGNPRSRHYWLSLLLVTGLTVKVVWDLNARAAKAWQEPDRGVPDRDGRIEP